MCYQSILSLIIGNLKKCESQLRRKNKNQTEAIKKTQTCALRSTCRYEIKIGEEIKNCGKRQSYLHVM